MTRSPSNNINFLSVESILIGKQILTNQTITFKDSCIESVVNCTDKSQPLLSGILVPGFIDIQVNGGGGCLFNQAPDLDSIKVIAKAHQRYGTTGWLPTLITDSFDKMKCAANAVAKARRNKILGVLGIHFEGPHLSVAKKGVHLEKYIREIGDVERDIFMRKDLGKVVVTVAPENIALSVIRELVAAGVIVCLGHSNASFEQTQQALDAGAAGFTHLFNAMSQFNSREPGMVGAALLNRQSYYGMILDGIHVHPDSVKLALKMNSNMMLVTDAMPTVGSEKNHFDFFEQTIQKNDSTLRDMHGKLAGSNLNMALAFRNCLDKLNFDHAKASRVTSLNAAKFIGLDTQYGSLSVAKKANMVLLNNKNEVVSCWINGRKVFA